MIMVVLCDSGVIVMLLLCD